MSKKLKVLDLFSGIGGFSLGLERTGKFETVAFCEIDPFCQKVLNKHWPDVEVYEDVRSLEYRGPVDVICGGYPCQPFSVAGERKGADDDRHLWPAMFSLIQKHRPSWVIGENVAGHISMGLDDVLTDLEREGYTTRTFVVPACAVDAKHRRDRVWIVAHAGHGAMGNIRIDQRGDDTQGERSADTDTPVRPSDEQEAVADHDMCRCAWSRARTKEHDTSIRSQDVCHTASKRFPNWAGGQVGQPGPLTQLERPNGREVELSFCGMAHGVSRRVDRLKALGNAVVPQIPEIIGYAIAESEGL